MTTDTIAVNPAHEVCKEQLRSLLREVFFTESLELRPEVFHWESLHLEVTSAENGDGRGCIVCGFTPDPRCFSDHLRMMLPPFSFGMDVSTKYLQSPKKTRYVDFEEVTAETVQRFFWDVAKDFFRNANFVFSMRGYLPVWAPQMDTWNQDSSYYPLQLVDYSRVKFSLNFERMENDLFTGGPRAMIKMPFFNTREVLAQLVHLFTQMDVTNFESGTIALGLNPTQTYCAYADIEAPRRQAGLRLPDNPIPANLPCFRDLPEASALLYLSYIVRALSQVFAQAEKKVDIKALVSSATEFVRTHKLKEGEKGDVILFYTHSYR